MDNTILDKFGNAVPTFYQGYFINAGDDDLVKLLNYHHKETKKLILSIPPDKENYAYDKGKWTIKDLFIHMIDAERIFTIRALRFARNDATPLPGFEEGNYVFHAQASSRSLQSIADEYDANRASTIELFSNFNDEMLARIGIANELKISVETLGRALLGHEIHHKKIIHERYL